MFKCNLQESVFSFTVSILHMSKPSQLALSNYQFSNLYCTCDSLILNIVHPGNSQREPQHLDLCHIQFCFLSPRRFSKSHYSLVNFSFHSCCHPFVTHQYCLYWAQSTDEHFLQPCSTRLPFVYTHIFLLQLMVTTQ